MFIELSWLILNIVGDQPLFSEFVKTADNKGKEFWVQNLKSHQLNSRLSEIETSFGFDDDLLKFMSSLRKSTYSFYSNIVHHSYYALMMGAYSSSENTDELEFNVFGKVSNSSKSTVEVLGESYWYFLVSFFALLLKKYRLQSAAITIDLWVESFALYSIAKNLYRYKREQSTTNEK